MVWRRRGTINLKVTKPLTAPAHVCSTLIYNVYECWLIGFFMHVLVGYLSTVYIFLQASLLSKGALAGR